MANLSNYKDKNKRMEYLQNYKKSKYKTLLFNLDIVKDKKILEYFDKSENKTQALRKLFR